LSGFADDELAAALDAGIIHPGATRAAIAAWLARYRAGRTADQNPDAAAMVTYAVIRLPTSPPQELVDEINGILKPLHKFADVEVCYPLADACLRPKVRQLVADTKAARLADRPTTSANRTGGSCGGRTAPRRSRLAPRRALTACAPSPSALANARRSRQFSAINSNDWYR
jgi:hypothetical protein